MIIKINAILPQREIAAIKDDIQQQAKTGVVVLPEYCELLSTAPSDERIIFRVGGRKLCKHRN